MQFGVCKEILLLCAVQLWFTRRRFLETASCVLMGRNASNSAKKTSAPSRLPSKKELSKKNKAADTAKKPSKKGKKKSSSDDSTSSTSSEEEEPMWTQQEMQQFRTVAAGFGLILGCSVHSSDDADVACKFLSFCAVAFGCSLGSPRSWNSVKPWFIFVIFRPRRSPRQ